MKNINLRAIYGMEVTHEQLTAAGFRKVDERGSSYITVTYYNPETDEGGSIPARDYEYSDRSRNNDSIYDANIDERVRRDWMHKNGAIFVGDTVVVVKGRKIPKGTFHTVIRIKEIHDRFGRWQADYLIFDDGMSTNITNCVLA